MPGGEPFSVLLGDYEIHPRPGPDHPTDDISTLGKIAGVAAAAFAPFLAGIHPSFLDLESFADLERPLDLSRTLEQVQYTKWKALRGTDDARFVGLVMPRVLMRLPYDDSTSRVDRFRFREDVAGPDRKGYLWGNAVYSFGSILLHSFSECSWLADIRGVPQDERSGGLISGLPVQSFSTDSLGIAVKSSTDARITDRLEKELADLGLIPLSYCPDTEVSAFFSNQSVQQPRKYDDPVATANARLSVMLQYMLCVARFAHYLKVMTRDKVGSFTTSEELQEYLRRWLVKYTAAQDKADMATKARFPLRESQVQIREHPGKPGSFLGVIHLRPHFQLDQVITAVRLTTELSAPNRNG
jgi:type VI secretion system protein ImpD